MSVNLNLKRILQESAKEDEYAAQIDSILDKQDLLDIFEKACPITGEIAERMNEQASDPANLKIVQDESTNNFFIDMNELVNYCEASRQNVDKALGTIFEFYYRQGFAMNKDNFNIVFPMQEAYLTTMNNKIGYQDLAWSSHFLQNCINKGLKCVTYVDPGLDKDKGKDDPDNINQIDNN